MNICPWVEKTLASSGVLPAAPSPRPPGSGADPQPQNRLHTAAGLGTLSAPLLGLTAGLDSGVRLLAAFST